MLEQSRLMHLLAQDSRLREELVMNLIQADEHTLHSMNGRSAWESI